MSTDVINVYTHVNYCGLVIFFVFFNYSNQSDEIVSSLLF